MTRLARLPELCLEGREPLSALFCTYGFEARFFEAEVIPAMFPVSLGLDSESGFEDAYLNSADITLALHQVGVFYDHLIDEGPQLRYAAWPVYVAPRAFHAKLIVLDYGDLVRVVIGSANLTRAAWTRLLELFTVEDLVPGDPHPWSEGLQQFVGRLRERIPDGQAALRHEIAASLGRVPQSQGASRVTSTWEEPLLDALLHDVDDARFVHAVTPFFEGSDGPGVFDALHKRLGAVRGRLYTSTADVDGRARVSGPPEKLQALITDGGWELHGVDKVWDGDEDGAPLRELHGKLLSVTNANGTRSMIGSANLTRAALLERAPQANVELVVIESQSAAELKRALPQATRLSADTVDFEEAGDPAGEDDASQLGPGGYIVEATYTAASRRLSLVIAPGAPDLTIRYADAVVAGQIDGAVWSSLLELALQQYVTVHDGQESSVVPFVIVDPFVLEPRGTASAIDLDEFLDILAGRRESVSIGEMERVPESGGTPKGEAVPTRGAIPWRRYLAAVEGIGFELAQELDVEIGLRFTIENPTRLAGLLQRLEDAHDAIRFTDADLLYALYELERELSHVLALDAPDSSRRLLEEARAGIERRSAELVGLAGKKLALQIKVLRAPIKMRILASCGEVQEHGQTSRLRSVVGAHRAGAAGHQAS
ncbi:MAG: hypothetical protein ACYDA6_10660, partial [Solirubrobacteraceae bacterium]